MSIENLFAAWREFRRGKRKKAEVQEFEFHLEDNLFSLGDELLAKTWTHGSYKSFYVRDPKLRHIHKASVRDRVLHQAVFRVLYPIFDKSFIFDSYSCQLDKGNHRAVRRLEMFARKLSWNDSRTIYALKCDVKKFFDSVDHTILLTLISEKVGDADTLWLMEKIIHGFQKEQNKGLPLGNVTSQLFANIYLNELDQFAKHGLREKYYIRYCDDFLILNKDESRLIIAMDSINNFLNRELCLELHPRKIEIRKYRRGIDFLGYVAMPYHSVLRTRTKRRMFRKIETNLSEMKGGLRNESSFNSSIQSYLGVLKHCKGYKIKKRILEIARVPFGK